MDRKRPAQLGGVVRGSTDSNVVLISTINPWWNRLIRLLFLLAASFGPALGQGVPDSAEPVQLPKYGPGAHSRRVLVFNSYHQGYGWTDAMVRGIRAIFRDAPEPIDADFEYLDARRQRDPAIRKAYLDYLRVKLDANPPEVILTTDDPALRVVLENRGSTFPTVPVIFCGVDEFQGSSAYVSAHPEQKPWLAGVLEDIDIIATVDLALHLHPETREIVTYGGRDGVDYPALIRAIHPGIRVRSLPVRQLNFEQTAAELAKLREGTIVLFSAFTYYGPGIRISIRDSSLFVAQHCKVPIYTLSRPSLGYGVVGGKMADPELQGRLAAQMMLQVLAGKTPQSLGIQHDSGNFFEFDYKQLARWNISPGALPSGSIVINRPKSFTQTHPWLIVALCIFLALQFVAIIILLMQHHRRRAAEAALRTHSQQLAQSNYMLEQFAYITAHDLQEPIRTVALFAELLRRDTLDELDDRGQKSLEFILEQARRLHSMVRGLLAWVRAVDAPSGTAIWCDADQILREVLATHQPQIEREQIAIDASHLPCLAVHSHHMRELLDQLVQNAIQHGVNAQPKIAIRSEREENAWKISVYNSGPPIPESFRNRIFGVFRRLQHTPPGIGMGLAICRRIVDYYGGSIWVDAAAEPGCTFTFTVPDTPRPRARRPHRPRQPVSVTSPHAHTDH